MGADLLVETLARIDEIKPEKQDSSEASYAPILKKEDGRIDWASPAACIHNRIRGLQPWPGAYAGFRGQTIHLWRSRLSGRRWKHVRVQGSASCGADKLPRAARVA